MGEVSLTINRDSNHQKIEFFVGIKSINKELMIVWIIIIKPTMEINGNTVKHNVINL